MTGVAKIACTRHETQMCRDLFARDAKAMLGRPTGENSIAVQTAICNAFVGCSNLKQNSI